MGTEGNAHTPLSGRRCCRDSIGGPPPPQGLAPLYPAPALCVRRTSIVDNGTGPWSALMQRSEDSRLNQKPTLRIRCAAHGLAPTQRAQRACRFPRIAPKRAGDVFRRVPLKIPREEPDVAGVCARALRGPQETHISVERASSGLAERRSRDGSAAQMGGAAAARE